MVYLIFGTILAVLLTVLFDTLAVFAVVNIVSMAFDLGLSFGIAESFALGICLLIIRTVFSVEVKYD